MRRSSVLSRLLTSLALATTPVLCKRYSSHSGRMSCTNSHESHRTATNPYTSRLKRPDCAPRESCRERFGNAAMTDTDSPLGGDYCDWPGFHASTAAARRQFLLYTGRNPTAIEECAKR